MRKVASVLALLVLVGMIAALYVPSASAQKERRRLFAPRLTGEKEVPGPGDDNGIGRARINANGERRRICFRLRFRRIGRVNAAHIHAAPRGEPGDVVVTLIDAGGGSIGREVRRVGGCARGVDRALIRNIKERPRQYYVNIHTNRFPAGAIRGQLHQRR